MTFIRIIANSIKLECATCKTLYRLIDVGKHHLYATCEKCQVRHEVGLTFEASK